MTDEVAVFTAKDVAAHKDAEDAWMVIQGKVYDVTQYLQDHPGGAEVLIEAAGTDATEAFDDAGHSEEASEIMAEYLVGTLREEDKKPVAKPVKVTPRPNEQPSGKMSLVGASTVVKGVLITLGAVGVGYVARLAGGSLWIRIPSRLAPGSSRGGGLGFLEGFLVASALTAVAGTFASQKFMKLLDFNSNALRYPPHLKLPKKVQTDALLERGWLDPTTSQSLPLVEKELIAPNTYRFVFSLPTSQTVLGLPIGQHVTITATIDGKTVNRSYTPTSNNADVGKLELVIKCYPDGLLTGRYLANLNVGDEVQFRGPKGAMRYRPDLCKKIGMLAGGTGITPMYQLIRAICEDERDTTKISLVYANRTEDDILLRRELESFARRYPKNFRLYYLLDNPPEDWAYGSGFVTKDIMAKWFPAPSADSKVMLCGPPGMINAAKKALVSLGFDQPSVSSKMTDQIFCF